MRRELAIHLFSFLVLFLALTVLRHWLTPTYIALWVGGLLGTFLPDIDHLLYALYLRPHELTSQRTRSLLAQGNLLSTLNLLATTRRERTNLLFHTAWFQILFLLLTFWTLSSSPSLLGRGLVLAFSFHLIVDQIIDFLEIDSLQNWFWSSPVNLKKEHHVLYLVGVTLSLLGLALFL